MDAFNLSFGNAESQESENALECQVCCRDKDSEEETCKFCIAEELEASKTVTDPRREAWKKFLRYGSVTNIHDFTEEELRIIHGEAYDDYMEAHRKADQLIADG